MLDHFSRAERPDSFHRFITFFCFHFLKISQTGFIISRLFIYSLVIFLQVGNLAAPVEEWTVGGTPLTSLMDVERRHGSFLYK